MKASVNGERWSIDTSFLKGLYTLVLEKKRAFLRFFFWKNNTIFFKKLNVYLFLHVIRFFMNFFKRKYL